MATASALPHESPSLQVLRFQEGVTMVVAQQHTATWRPAPVRADDDLFVSLAAEVGTQCAPRAAAHDRDNTFVTENYALLRDAGYTRLAAPKGDRKSTRLNASDLPIAHTVVSLNNANIR